MFDIASQNRIIRPNKRHPDPNETGLRLRNVLTATLEVPKPPRKKRKDRRSNLEGSAPAIWIALFWCDSPTTMNMHCLQLSATSSFPSPWLPPPLSRQGKTKHKSNVNLKGGCEGKREKERGFKEETGGRTTQTLARQRATKECAEALSNNNIMEERKLRCLSLQPPRLLGFFLFLYLCFISRKRDRGPSWSLTTNGDGRTTHTRRRHGVRQGVARREIAALSIWTVHHVGLEVMQVMIRKDINLRGLSIVQ